MKMELILSNSFLVPRIPLASSCLPNSFVQTAFTCSESTMWNLCGTGSKYASVVIRVLNTPLESTY